MNIAIPRQASALIIGAEKYGKVYTNCSWQPHLGLHLRDQSHSGNASQLQQVQYLQLDTLQRDIH